MQATSDEQTEPASPEAVADAEAVATLLNSVLSNQVDLTQAAHEAAASSAELPPAVEEPIPTKEAAQETSAGAFFVHSIHSTRINLLRVFLPCFHRLFVTRLQRLAVLHLGFVAGLGSAVTILACR